MAKGKKYSEEFKESAVQLVLNTEDTVKKVAKDLEIGEKTLYVWIRAYKNKYNLDNSQKSISIETIEEENRRLRRENALLKKEKEILKKAAAYFAKETM